MHAAARRLSSLLAESAPLWRPAPFRGDPLWTREHPALLASLLALDDNAVQVLEHDAAQLSRFISRHTDAALFADLNACVDDCIDHTVSISPIAAHETDARDIPGRKWHQLLHFAAACGAPRGPVIEWCSGKAHLGRALSRHYGVNVTSIERNADLCRDGQWLAGRERLPVTLLCRDVHELEAAGLAGKSPAHGVALHACGDLHIALMQKGVAAGFAAFDIAPCCYHLTAAPTWQPMSKTLADTLLPALALAREELHLAVQETVTSSARVTRQRDTLAAWRLGFDSLQRDLRGVLQDDATAALPTPSRPLQVLQHGFTAFCTDMAAHHALALPADTDFPHYENRGRAKLARVRRLDLLRHAFRRPLEVLLVADRALWLSEQGYTVRLHTLCPRELTPRNLLIQARHAEEE